MPLEPRKEVAGLAPARHGGPDYAELEALGVAAAEIIDFSVCSNPFGPPPGVRDALASAAIDRYPDTEATGLRRALATPLGVSPQNILVGNGSTELIRLAAQVYFNPGDMVIIPTPNFGEYEVASRLCGARIIMPSLRPDDCFHLPVADIADLIRQHRARGLFLSNPHNPTGQFLPRKDVETLLEASANCLVIVDEAYISFVDNAWSSPELIARQNLIILRSMTKDYALAGLRLGYALARRQIIDNLHRAKPPWNVNAVAQQAGLLALEETKFLAQSLKQLRQARDSLMANLAQLGFPPLPTQANFFLVRVENARDFREHLLRQKLLVRDCTSFGLPEYVRLAPRTPAENDKLIAAIEELSRHGRLHRA